MVKNIYSSYIKKPFTPKKNNILGVLIHNDAGAMTPSQYLTWLTNRVKNGQAELGFAALYINRHEALWFSPTDHAEWHAGNQYGNYNFIGFEVAESMPSKTNNATFLENEEATLKVAAEVMKSYNLTPNRDTVRLHNEFTSTACPHRSWAIHLGNVPYTQANKNKLKDYFISRIKYYMGSGASAPTPSQPAATKPKTTTKKSNATVVNEVIAGTGGWGNGATREQRLKNAGYNAQAIQNAVNKKLGAKTVKPKAAPKKKSVATVAREIIDGRGGWGNGNTRKTRLRNAGYNANTVQAEVNRRLGAGSTKKKSVDQVARDIINGRGNWGTGNTRFNRLRNAGYDANAVQRRINQLL